MCVLLRNSLTWFSGFHVMGIGLNKLTYQCLLKQFHIRLVMWTWKIILLQVVNLSVYTVNTPPQSAHLSHAHTNSLLWLPWLTLHPVNVWQGERLSGGSHVLQRICVVLDLRGGQKASYKVSGFQVSLFFPTSICHCLSFIDCLPISHLCHTTYYLLSRVVCWFHFEMYGHF